MRFNLIVPTIAAALSIFGATPAYAKDVPAKKESAEIPQPLNADAALKELINGNQRFITEKTRNDGQQRKDVERLARGQAPNSIVLSCSDSRVPPELVFDQKLGEVFAVRTAGESLSPEAIGSIEYAIAKLGSHLIVVLGYYVETNHLGAVFAAETGFVLERGPDTVLAPDIAFVRSVNCRSFV